MGVLTHLIRKRNVGALIGAGIVALFVLTAVAAPLLYSWDAATGMNLSAAKQPPSWGQPFGTDELGRDLLARVVWGGRISLLIGVVSVGISVLLGSALGLIAGFYEGRVSELIMRMIDGLLAFPRILFAIVFIAILGTGLTSLMIAIGISTVPVFARLVRGPTLSLRSREFVLAANALGAPDRWILAKHLWPNVAPLVVVQASLSIAEAILVGASLSFLGMGPQPPTPEWGSMIATSRSLLRTEPYIVFGPGIALFLVVLGFNLFGDGLRDALDPRVARQ